MSNYDVIPGDPEAEQALLGAVMLRPAILPDVIARFGEENPFNIPKHRQIWDTLLLFHEIGTPVDRIALNASLDTDYLSECIISVPTSANWRLYADTVKNAAWRRHAVEVFDREAKSIASGHPIEESLGRIREVTEIPRSADLELDQLHEWWNPPPPSFIIQDLCDAGTTTVISSPGGLGKSLFALGLGLSVATGTALFPSFIPTQAGTALYLSGEDTEDKLKLRMAAYDRQYSLSRDLLAANWHTKSKGNRALIQGDRNHGVTITPYYTSLQAWCREHQPKLIIFDTLRRAIGGIPGGENDNPTVGFLIERITDLVRPHGGMALVLSHSRKPTGDANADPTSDDARGASALKDEARTHLMMRRDPEGTDILVTLTKANYAPHGLLYTTWRFGFAGAALVEQGKSEYTGADPAALIPMIVDYIRTSTYRNNPQKLAQNAYCKYWRDNVTKRFPWVSTSHILAACELAVKQGKLETFEGKLGSNKVPDLLRIPTDSAPATTYVQPQGELYDEPYSEEPFDDEYIPFE